MALSELPSPDLLRQLLRYDQDTGLLYWRRRPRKFFANDAEFKRWNDRYAEREAFTHVTADGYRRGAFLYRLHLAHRVIFAMVHGRWPTGQIDHIDGDRSNNRIDNLRDCTPEDNARNQRRPARNSSGRVGVVWAKNMGRWVARIGIGGGRLRKLGYFDTVAEASAAREAAERELGYHINHGRAK